MKGFGIYVKNNLIDPKHIESMGVAVWLYLWFLDKMTSVNEQGVGKVLGGRPINYEKDVYLELGISESTYNRWISKLRDCGYVNTIRTPYGLIPTINKAEKIWRSRTVKSDGTKPERTVTSDITEPSKVGERTVTSDGSNKTIQRQYNNNTKRGKIKFSQPSLEEVKKYCEERKNNVNAEQFINFYDSKGWYVGKNKMKDWKAAVRTWEQRHGSSSLPIKSFS